VSRSEYFQVSAIITDVEQRADELNRRAAALLDNRP